MTTGIHSCSYHCDRPECVKAQRDEFRELAELICHLSERDGCNLVSDDDGRWAVSVCGIQPVPEERGFREEVSIVSYVSPEEWRPSIVEALRAFRDSEDGDL